MAYSSGGTGPFFTRPPTDQFTVLEASHLIAASKDQPLKHARLYNSRLKGRREKMSRETASDNLVRQGGEGKLAAVLRGRAHTIASSKEPSARA